LEELLFGHHWYYRAKFLAEHWILKDQNGSLSIGFSAMPMEALNLPEAYPFSLTIASF
tara:strand:- start:1509 stop:1682 length:174 start_codon:yes stop_codon:yes gene_type:complete